MKQRLAFAGKDLDIDSKDYISLVNDYTLVVQEYFQQRLEIWMKTIGKHIFRIQHHWLRYEFAPGRGQIHAHMLAITDHKDIFQEAYLHRDHPDKQADILSNWAAETFGMTASIPNQNATTYSPPHDQHPSTIRFDDVTNHTDDAKRCLIDLQSHKCSSKCMKKRKQM